MIRVYFSLVDLIVDYAYTGSITLDWDSAQRVLLIANNLKCQQLINWCLAFLKER